MLFADPNSTLLWCIVQINLLPLSESAFQSQCKTSLIWGEEIHLTNKSDHCPNFFQVANAGAVQALERKIVKYVEPI